MLASFLDSIANQDGRIALITGANSGLGLETARILLEKDATVILCCRSKNNGLRAREDLIRETGSDKVELIKIDLADLSEVERVGKEIIDRYRRLDILINNAGVMAPPRIPTKQGLELQFTVNHLSHMALTLKLLPIIKQKSQGRIVTVSSAAQYLAKINWNDPQGENRYDRWASYSQSKLANVMFAIELDNRLRRSRLNIASLSAHPGLARTNLHRKSVETNKSFTEAMVYKFITPLSQSPLMGALPQLVAATDPKVNGGEQYGPRFNFRGLPKLTKIAPYALRREAREKLWELSMRLIEKEVDIINGKQLLLEPKKN